MIPGHQHYFESELCCFTVNIAVKRCTHSIALLIIIIKYHYHHHRPGARHRDRRHLDQDRAGPRPGHGARGQGSLWGTTFQQLREGRYLVDIYIYPFCWWNDGALPGPCRGAGASRPRRAGWRRGGAATCQPPGPRPAAPTSAAASASAAAS